MRSGALDGIDANNNKDKNGDVKLVRTTFIDVIGVPAESATAIGYLPRTQSVRESTSAQDLPQLSGEMYY
ncbi:hypothetical protein ON010_g19045 [Phytophthora cinnamomi]|nr:hypothetical protein ON010_g19045 [Phytophthora cinnamomi]